MDNTSLEKPNKLLLVNMGCLLLIVWVLVMSPLVSSARASGSRSHLGTSATHDPRTGQPPYSLATGSSYRGVIHNAAVDQTSDMTLSFTSVMPSVIVGNFTLTNGPLTGSGPFTGSMNNQRSLLFTSTATDGSNDTITFLGSIHPNDSSISGSYSGSSPTVPVQTGIWYVVPQASYPPKACDMAYWPLGMN